MQSGDGLKSAFACGPQPLNQNRHVHSSIPRAVLCSTLQLLCMTGPHTRYRKDAGQGWVAVTHRDFKRHCMEQSRVGHSSAFKTYLHPDTWTGHWNQSLKRSLEVLGFSSVTVHSQRTLSPVGWQKQTVVCASWETEPEEPEPCLESLEVSDRFVVSCGGEFGR